MKAALHLLKRQGRDAVTTRSVAEAAGVQPPVLYRLFGDKTSLLDAVAVYGFTAYLAKKRPAASTGDPVEALRSPFSRQQPVHWPALRCMFDRRLLTLFEGKKQQKHRSGVLLRLATANPQHAVVTLHDL